MLKNEFNTPANNALPLLQVNTHIHTATFRYTDAAIGATTTARTP